MSPRPALRCRDGNRNFGKKQTHRGGGSGKEIVKKSQNMRQLRTVFCLGVGNIAPVVASLYCIAHRLRIWNSEFEHFEPKQWAPQNYRGGYRGEKTLVDIVDDLYRTDVDDQIDYMESLKSIVSVRKCRNSRETFSCRVHLRIGQQCMQIAESCRRRENFPTSPHRLRRRREFSGSAIIRQVVSDGLSLFMENFYSFAEVIFRSRLF